jgi:hypothetical protein
MVRLMRCDRHTLTRFGGLALLVIGSALLLEDASAVFVPVIGMVGGLAAMALANHERLKQRIEALETRLAVGMARRDQPHRINSGLQYSWAVLTPSK